MENGLTASDVALMQKDSGCGWADSSFMWIFALLILLFGGNGFGLGGGGLQQGFAEQQRCCCETLRAIDGVNYNASLNTASINATTVAQTQKILDAITTNRMNDMQNQINALQLQNAVAGVVRYPTQTSYCSGANPFGCGCNNL